MQFTTVSHACMSIRNGGVELLIDPWIIGSCYWRSWWNFPEPDKQLLDSLKPDYVYLTHLHWDHFHGPSLQRFARSTKLLVPKVPTTRRMVEDLEYLGFHDVVEVDHGHTIELGGRLTLTSFQWGPSSDSAVVVSDGKTTILDANDCKSFGLCLRQITKRFPDIDFVLRSHSNASAIPYCIEGYGASDLGAFRKPQAYIEEFARFAFAVNARYAIPFASNHIYLHRDTIKYNRLAVRADTVADYANAEAERLGARTETVLMPSGSTWDDHEGFACVAFSYDNTETYVSDALRRNAAKLEAYYEEEVAAQPNHDAFRDYFSEFLRSLPPRLLYRPKLKVVFEITGGDTSTLWMVDLEGRRLDLELEKSPDDAIVIRTPTRILNDCCQIRMFATWTPSKRMSIRLPEHDSISQLMTFFLLLDLFEHRMLPLRNNLSPRAITGRLRRWREAADAAKLALDIKLKKGFKIADLYPLPP
jgi:UDP-MurNAc hydroxylase